MPTIVQDGTATITASAPEAEVLATLKSLAKPAADEPVGGSAEIIPDEKPVDLQATVAPTSTETDETKTATERDASGKFVKKDPVQARIDKAVAAQRNAERERDALKAQLASKPAETARTEPESTPARTAATPAPTYGDLAKRYAAHPDYPKIEQFAAEADPYESWRRAESVFLADARYAELRVAEQAKQQQDAALTEAQERFEAHLKAGAEAHPDFDAVMSSEFARTFIFPPHIVEAINVSERGGDLMHYLASHPDEARAIAALPPTQALLKLGSIDRQEPAPSGSGSRTPLVTRAKPPIKPVGSSPSSPDAVPPEDLPFGPKYIEAMNAKEQKQREARSGR